MEDPVDIKALLEPFFLFGVGSGFSAIGRTPPAQGGIEGLQMIGMDLGILNRRRGVRMLPPTFRTPLVEVAYFTVCLAN
jgi:hypothetical protein